MAASPTFLAVCYTSCRLLTVPAIKELGNTQRKIPALAVSVLYACEHGQNHRLLEEKTNCPAGSGR